MSDRTASGGQGVHPRTLGSSSTGASYPCSSAFMAATGSFHSESQRRRMIGRWVQPKYNPGPCGPTRNSQFVSESISMAWTSTI
jgi:hypothetical protein